MTLARGALITRNEQLSRVGVCRRYQCRSVECPWGLIDYATERCSTEKEYLIAWSTASDLAGHAPHVVTPSVRPVRQGRSLPAFCPRTRRFQP